MTEVRTDIQNCSLRIVTMPQKLNMKASDGKHRKIMISNEL